MISVTELRNGTIYEDQGQLFQVLSYEHIKMGRGTANVKIKVKNLRSGAITNKSFISGSRVSDIQLERKEVQFLYRDAQSAYFMDPKIFEQFAVPLNKLTGFEYLKDGENFFISFFDNEPLFLEMPPKMKFRVAETGPSEKGNSATTVFKDAILENGLKTKVPPFIKIGDLISIDTRTGQYSQKI